MTFFQEVQLAIVSGLVAIVPALGAVLWTQWRADKRESQVQEAVADRQARERRRQQAARAHAAFLKEVDQTADRVGLFTRVGEGEHMPDELTIDWDWDVRRALVDVQLFAPATSAGLAEELAAALKGCEEGTVGAMMETQHFVDKYRRAVQTELDLEVTRLGPKWQADQETH